MKRFLTLVLSGLLLLSMIPVTAAESSDALSLFVQANATNGDGSMDAPFGTIEEARDHIRELKANGSYPQKGVAVYLRGGVYNLKSGIKFDEQDSGTAEGPITYRAYKDEEVTLTAGVSLNLNQFKTVTDQKVLSRIPAAARGQVLQINLLDQGLTREGLGEMSTAGARASTLIFIKYYGSPVPNAELFFEDEQMTLARWPNDEYAKIGEVVRVGDLLRNDMEELSTDMPVGSIFQGAGERLSYWQTAPDAWVHGYWQYDWLDCAAKIDEVDPEEGTISLVHTVEPVAGKRFYAYNLLEELDVKGEWYLERETGILYFYPPKKSGTVSLSLLLDDVFTLEHVEHVSFKALTMSAARGNFFTLESCRNVNIENCEMSYTAASAVVMNGACYDNKVQTCHIFGIGKHGIGLAGGDLDTLTQGNNVVENCWIHNFSRLMKNSAPAVVLNGCGNRIAHNRINDAPQWGLRLIGAEHTIEYNEIYDVLQESADAGVIYAWASLTNYGNVIRHNYIHDCETNSEQTHGIMCFYMDNMFSGTTFESNIIENFPGSAFAINGGRDTTIRNNIMINVDSFAGCSAPGNYGITSDHYDSATLKNFGIGGDDPTYLKPAYAKYPQISGLMDDIMSTPDMNGNMGGVHPKRCLYENNVGISLKQGFHFAHTLGLTADYLNSINTFDQPWMTATDPGFVNYEGRNYTLKEDSEIYEQFPDFVAPDFENIGIYTPEMYERLDGAISMRIGSPVTHEGLTYGLVDEENTDVTPVIVNDKTMVPVRFMAETLGGMADWDGDTQTATITVGSNTLVIDGATGTMTLNGTAVEGESPVNLNGRFLVPLRVISETMNKKVDWYDQGMIIVSDTENVFDKEKEVRMIEELFRRLSFR